MGCTHTHKKLKSYCFTLVRNFYRLRDWSKGINSLQSGWTYVWQLCAFKVSDKRQKVHRSVGEVGTGLGILKVHPCEVHMQPAWRITWPDLHLLFWFITLAMGPATSWNLWCLLKTERRTPQGYKRLPWLNKWCSLQDRTRRLWHDSLSIHSSKLEVYWVIWLLYLAPSRTGALPLFLSPAPPQEGALASARPVSNSWLSCLGPSFVNYGTSSISTEASRGDDRAQPSAGEWRKTSSNIIWF